MNTAKRLISSATFSTGAKVIQRSIGLISTLILARLLTPEDFAYVAIIAITLHFFDILSQVGSEQYIIRKETVNEDALQSAWTLDLIIKTAMFTVLVLFATPIMSLFNKAEIAFALQVASSVLIFNALRSPGIILLKRNLDYQKIFYLELTERLVSFTVIILIAYIWRNYWAFIAADIAAAVTFLIGSYHLCPYKPKLQLKNFFEQWFFSKWMLGKSILGYIRSQIDTLLVARYFGATQLGQYYMARDIAMLPAHNLLSPAIEPLLAALRDDKPSDTSKTKQRFIYALSATTFITAPIVIYTAFYGDLIVFTLLGSQWHMAADLLSIMSMLLAYLAVLLVVESCFLARGQVKTLFVSDLLSLILICSSLLALLLNEATLEQVVWLRALTGSLCTLTLLGWLMHQLKIKLMGILIAITPPYFIAFISIHLTVLLVDQAAGPVWLLFIISGSFFVFLFTMISLTLLFLGKNITPFNYLFSLLLEYRQQATNRPISK